VQSREQRPHTSVPVGPRYKRVPVQSTLEPNRPAIINHEEETRPATPVAKVQAKSRNNKDNQGDENKDNNRKQKKIKVENE
jgi:hypothetical protein